MSEETNDDSIPTASGDEPTTDSQSVEPASHSSSTWKVLGETDASDGTGVLGHSTSASGVTTGVSGIVDSSYPGAVGVRGIASGDNVGILGQAQTDTPSLGTLNSSESAGVFGRTDKDAGYGMVGWSNNSHGIVGRSDDGASSALYGVNMDGGYGLNTHGDAAVSGNLEVSGHNDVGNVGVSAYLGSSMTIDNGVISTIEYDSEVADHFDDFDITSGRFTPSQDGVYHISAAVGTSTSLSSGDDLLIYIYHNGTQVAENHRIVGDSGAPNIQVNKTLYGVSSGEDIYVALLQVSGGQIDLNTGRAATYVTIDKVG